MSDCFRVSIEESCRFLTIAKKMMILYLKYQLFDCNCFIMDAHYAMNVYASGDNRSESESDLDESRFVNAPSCYADALYCLAADCLPF